MFARGRIFHGSDDTRYNRGRNEKNLHILCAFQLPSAQNEQRSPRSRQNAPKVDDEHDFPSLG